MKDDGIHPIIQGLVVIGFILSSPMCWIGIGLIFLLIHGAPK